MANVNIAQLRTSLAGVRPERVVLIHANVLKQMLDAYKASSGNDFTVTTVTTQTPEPPLDLTRF